MLKGKSFLAVDFGAGTIRIAEFEQNEAEGLRLRQFGVKSLGPEGAQESTREATIIRTLQTLLSEKDYASRSVNVCAPGFHVFSKFVKLPPVDTSKVTQIIQYEAQQNVPFPLQEVVWDYQILGTSGAGELEVLLVAIKSDIVEGLFRVCDGAGLKLQLVDVSPAALCNAFRYNYGDIEGCTMLLDIGAKTSNLLFFEKGKIYSRSINIGANSITQDFANEAKLSFTEAEEIKIAEGFVSLGGAYEEPDNPRQAAISKIARQVMTRLHIQVNQTIQFFRAQQGGSPPQRLFLSGGASIMAYTAEFFAEKLNVPVEYFNPFRNIQIDQGVNIDELSQVAHSFGEVVGLGLRNLAHCPVELNLMPKTSIDRQEFNQKKPFLAASAFALALILMAVGWFKHSNLDRKRAKVEEIQAKLNVLTPKQSQMQKLLNQTAALQAQAEQLAGLVEDRFYAIEVLNELRQIAAGAETAAKQALNTEVGVWFESVAVGAPPPMEGVDPAMAAAMPPDSGADPSPRRRRRGGGDDESAAGTNSMLITVCRAVDRSKVSPTAKDTLAYAVYQQATNSPLISASGTTLGGINDDPATQTFTFGLNMKLKRPFRE